MAGGLVQADVFKMGGTEATGIGTAANQLVRLDGNAKLPAVDGSALTSVVTGAHATSHQNGGADEISVAGLSGALADAQTPTAHTHGQCIPFGVIPGLFSPSEVTLASTFVKVWE